jgi:hypothetical protein
MASHSTQNKVPESDQKEINVGEITDNLKQLV